MLRVLPGLAAGLFVVAVAVAFLTSPVLAGSCGGASWYGRESCSNPKCLTASGARFDQNAMTAAHKTLPFGTRLRVVDQATGKSVRVTVNDRGPFVRGRIIDLSKAAATRLGMRGRGVARVCLGEGRAAGHGRTRRSWENESMPQREQVTVPPQPSSNSRQGPVQSCWQGPSGQAQ